MFTSLHNPVAVREVRERLESFRPDVVQVQNVYPLISPSVVPAIKRAGLPVVMRCPNYRLFCPNGLFLEPSGKVCERCTGRGGEVWCMLKNCEEDWLKSSAYALRNAVTRLRRALLNHVDVFIVQSEFQRQKFMSLGIPEDRLAILPGILPLADLPVVDAMGGDVTFVGRVSPEKGIYEFVAAARRLPEIPFVVAGGHPSDVRIMDSPANLRWLGFLDSQQLDRQCRESRVIVVPSRWYEGFPNVILRAMALGRPVITSRIGALQDIVVDGVTGLHVPPGSVQELAQAIAELHSDPSRCVRMGRTAQSLAQEQYGPETIYRALVNIYQRALDRSGSGAVA